MKLCDRIEAVTYPTFASIPVGTVFRWFPEGVVWMKVDGGQHVVLVKTSSSVVVGHVRPLNKGHSISNRVIVYPDACVALGDPA